MDASEEVTRILGTEAVFRGNIKNATEFLEKLMGEKTSISKHIMTNYKISEIIIHINTLGEEIRYIQKNKSYFCNTKCQKIMEHFRQNFRELVWNDKYYAQPASCSDVKSEKDIIGSLERTALTSLCPS